MITNVNVLVVVLVLVVLMSSKLMLMIDIWYYWFPGSILLLIYSCIILEKSKLFLQF